MEVKSLKDLFTFIKLNTFLIKFTDINPMGGIYRRINGKSTNSSGKKTGLQEEEKTKLKEALLNFSDIVKQEADKL